MMASIRTGTVISLAAAAMLTVSPPALSGQGLGGGLRADLAFASFRNEDVDQSRRTGVRIGIFAQLELAGPLDVVGEIAYVNKGTKVKGADEAFELEYIEIPVAAKFSLGDSPVFLLAGPAFGFLVDSPYDDSDVLGTFDLGVLAGIGIDGTLGTVPLTFDVRYTTGFSTVFDFGPDDSDTDDRNQVISFGVGVRVF